MKEIETIFDKLYDFYKVGNINSLAKEMGVAPSTVSNWKQREAVKAIKKRCRELGIYNDIFYIYPPEAPMYRPEVRYNLEQIDDEIIKAGVKDFESYKKFMQENYYAHFDSEYDLALDYQSWLARVTVGELTDKHIIDSATFELVKEAYKKALDKDDLKGFRNYLMEY